MSRRVPPGNGPFSSEVHRIGSLDASQESSCVVSITILCLTPCQVYPADGASSSTHVRAVSTASTTWTNSPKARAKCTSANA